MINYIRCKKKLTFLIGFLLVSFSGVAQYSEFAHRDRDAQPAEKKRAPSTLYRTAITPTILIAGGVLTFNNNPVFDRYDVYQKRQELFPGFRTRVDDYLTIAPIAVVYGLDVLGVNAWHNFVNRSVRLLTAEALSYVVVLPLKNYTHVERPDGSNDMSFPSGHTTQAFVSATFVHKELGGISSWYSIGAYTTATAVGALRILNNKHWLTDVLVGAGVGILSTNLAYLIFPEDGLSKKRMSDVLIVPRYEEGSVGFYLRLTLH